MNLRFIQATVIAAAAIISSMTPANAQRNAMFDYFGTDSASIVMLGNSLTHGCEWNELLQNPNVKNRGISGETADDMIKRLHNVTDGKPAKIFMMAGVNDISHDLTVDSVARVVMRLVDSIMVQSPQTKLYVQSLLPINNSFGRYKTMTNREDTVRMVNEIIEKETAARGITFINLYDSFCDEDRNLRADWTADGLHLLMPAYIRWKEIIIPYVNE